MFGWSDGVEWFVDCGVAGWLVSGPMVVLWDQRRLHFYVGGFESHCCVCEEFHIHCFYCIYFDSRAITELSL